MKYSLFILLSLLLWSCDDPSLDGPPQVDEIVEPVPDLRQLSSIEVAINTPANVIRDINFNYNNKDLLSEITETGTINRTTQASYNNNNQLQSFSLNQTAQPLMNVSVSYGNDTNNQTTSFARLSYSETTGISTQKTLFLDLQNRFNRVLTTQTDVSGVTTVIEDLRFQYSQNFNVVRINKFDAAGLLITSFSEFTYNFNNNPFADMNDVIRLFMFDAFVPYSRNLPATRLDYDQSTGATILERSIDYQYTLDNEGFPTSRELTVTEAAVTTTYFEFFNYLP